MATWKKVIVSGSAANLASVQVDNLTTGEVVIGGGSSNLSTTAINGAGNIVATTGASGVAMSGSFSGSFFGDGSQLTGVVATDLAFELTGSTGIDSFTFDGSAAAQIAVSGASALNANTVTKWTGDAFANTNITDDGIVVDVNSDTIVSGSLTVTGNVISTGSLKLQPDATDARYLEIYNTSAQDTHITASGGWLFLGDDTTYVKVDNYSTNKLIELKADNGFVVSGSTTINGNVIITGSLSNGYYTQAIGTYSHAEGEGAIASGYASHAEGISTQAISDASHAEGQNTIASGSYSHAEGYYTQAIGDASHAEGQNTIASGSYSHAEGENTQVIGYASHAEGESTQAIGSYSHAEGEGGQSIGNYAHAEGSGTQAIGQGSHAEGQNTQALGNYSHVEGLGTIASGSYQHASGFYNTHGDDTSLFIIGNGVDDNNRSDLALFNPTSITFNAPVTGSTFSGSFVGDGSGLTGLVTTLSGSTDSGNFEVNLLNQYLTVQGTANEIEVSASGQTITIGLPSDVTISNNLTVTGDLIVNGTTTVINTTNTAIEDQFILLASGSTSTVDAGIIVQNAANAGEAFYWENNTAGTSRWAIASNISPTATTVTAAEYMVTANTAAGAPSSAPTYGGSSVGYGNMYVDSANGDIYIYS